MKEYGNHELVAINSLVPWSIYFHAESIRKDVEIPPLAKNYRQFNFGLVQDEISKGNSAFCGTDGFGNHAPLEIPDAEMREALFMKKTEPLQVTAEILKRTTKQKTQTALTEWLEKYFQTSSEKRLLMIYLDDLPEGERENLPMWFYRIVEQHFYSGTKEQDKEEVRFNW